MHDGSGKEWMNIIIVDNFPALDDPKGGANLRRSPSHRLCDTDYD